MPRRSSLTPIFVEFLPAIIEDGKLYVSMDYATATHLCCCGCGHAVVTPFSPTDWRLSFDGRSISLHPSIGNWSFPCRSHYIIRANDVVWVGGMSNHEITLIRQQDRQAKARYFGKALEEEVALATSDTDKAPLPSSVEMSSATVWERFVRIWHR